jgi:hypothetical protein
MIFFGDRTVQAAAVAFLAHYQQERNHQRLNRLRVRKRTAPLVRLCAGSDSAACCGTTTARRPDLLHLDAGPRGRVSARGLGAVTTRVFAISVGPPIPHVLRFPLPRFRPRFLSFTGFNRHVWRGCRSAEYLHLTRFKDFLFLSLHPALLSCLA